MRELPKDVLKMASGLISLSGLAGHRRQLCILPPSSLCGHLVHGWRDDALDGELPGGEAVLEVGQRLLEEGDEARLRRGVELLLQPRGEDLRLHPALNKTLTMIIISIMIKSEQDGSPV